MTERPAGPLVLYITNGFPFPLTSGYLRHYFLIGRLADAGCRVILLSVVGVDHRPEHAAAMADRTERVEVFASTDRGRGVRQRWMRRLRRVLPVGGGDPAAKRLAARAEQIVTSEPIDAVVFTGRRTDRALTSLGRLPVIVDMCDASSLRVERQMAVSGRVRRIALWIQRVQLRRTEARMLRRADRLLFASARDREDLLPGPRDPRAVIVPNGVDVAYWARTDRSLGRDAIVFTGAMSYAPNVDAAVRLARDILPRVQAAVPSASLAIVGRDPTPAVTALDPLPGVHVTGSVPDMRPYLEGASVFAAPLRFGAGIQNKLLEAMAMEVPAVVSTIAADGLRTERGDMPPVTVEDDDTAFAEALIRALRSAADDPSPDATARAFVARHFSWEECGRVLLEQIEVARATGPAGD